MNIVVGSAFRTPSQAHVDRYFNQVSCLVRHAGPSHSVRAEVVWGDSPRKTLDLLETFARRWNVEARFTEFNHGHPWFGSTESPVRMRHLSDLGNTILDQVRPEDDVMVYVESDLVWDPHTIGTLIDTVYEDRAGFDVIAPMIFAGRAFYDIWAFRKGGARFGPFPPYHHMIPSNGFTSVDSAGSCLVMKAEVARKARMRNGGALVDWCGDAREQNFKIGVALDYKVYHP